MAQFNFSCPHCNQLVQGEEQWSGQQIQCPACHGGIVVPQNTAAPVPSPVVPVPAPAAEPQKPVSKLRVTATPHAPAPPPPPQPPAVARHLAAAAQPKKKSDAAKWIKTSIVVLVFLVGAFFGFRYLSAWQERSNASRDDSADSGLAGQAGHIVALNDVLDRTDPDHMGMSSKEAAAEERREKRLKQRLEAEMRQRQSGGAPNEGAGISPEQNAVADAISSAAADMAKMPLASGVWALDTAVIPEGRANGMITGTNFVVNTASIVKVGASLILSLHEGTTNLRSEPALFISFQLPPGEELAGRTWNISQDMRGKGVPPVKKRWKGDPRYRLPEKQFLTGYAMTLELGQPTNGVIPGKVSVSLPDPEQSYVVGAFKAAMITPGGN